MLNNILLVIFWMIIGIGAGLAIWIYKNKYKIDQEISIYNYEAETEIESLEDIIVSDQETNYTQSLEMQIYDLKDRNRALKDKNEALINIVLEKNNEIKKLNKMLFK